MNTLWTMALAAAFTQAPCNCDPHGYSGYPTGGYAASGPVYGGPAYGGPVYGGAGYGGYAGYGYGGYPASYGTGPVSYAGDWSAVGGPVGPGRGGYDQLYPHDAPEPWLHGYWQEMPSYGGHYYFRPHNYKHVLSQSQTAAGWGMSPTMPYSQEVFRKYPPASTTPLSRAVRKPAFDEAAHRAALARVKAHRDATGVRTATSEETQSNTPASLRARLTPPVAPAVHTQRQLKLEELQEQIRRQQGELEDLQEALRRENERR